MSTNQFHCRCAVPKFTDTGCNFCACGMPVSKYVVTKTTYYPDLYSNAEQPYANLPDSGETLTVGDLIVYLSSLPKDYVVSYDSALGVVRKGDFTIYHNNKIISING